MVTIAKLFCVCVLHGSLGNVTSSPMYVRFSWHMVQNWGVCAQGYSRPHQLNFLFVIPLLAEMNACRCKTNKHNAKKHGYCGAKNDHVMHVTYRKEDVHMMATTLPRQLGNSTELEQASLCEFPFHLLLLHWTNVFFSILLRYPFTYLVCVFVSFQKSIHGGDEKQEIDLVRT